MTGLLIHCETSVRCVQRGSLRLSEEKEKSSFLESGKEDRFFEMW